MKDGLNGIQPQSRTTSMLNNNLMKVDFNGSLRNQMPLACIACQSCTELGPAKPQLGIILLLLFITNDNMFLTLFVRSDSDFSFVYDMRLKVKGCLCV